MDDVTFGIVNPDPPNVQQEPAVQQVRDVVCDIDRETFEESPFPTGSRVYGEPTRDSDVDLVVRCPRHVADWLAQTMPGEVRTANMTPDRDSTSFEFGNLNLILVHRINCFYAWAEATQICYDARPVTRPRAITIHDRCRKAHGVSCGDPS
jgi:hypothetical protein